MKHWPLLLSDASTIDILEQADWYESRGNEELLSRWNTAIESTLLRIAQNPGSGPCCHFKSAVLGEVRHILVDGFPRHIIFYQVSERRY